MARIESKEIDYDGKIIEKVLEQSLNPKQIIIDTLNSNGWKIERDINKNGYNQFVIKNENSSLNLNIFFSNVKFDLERPNVKNINLGTTIDNPFELRSNDNQNNQTYILAVYVFNQSDTCDDAILISCPIKNRNYKGNPSLRMRYELIQKARTEGISRWTNQANDTFIAFKPSFFYSDIIDFNIEGLDGSKVWTNIHLDEFNHIQDKLDNLNVWDKEVKTAARVEQRFLRQHLFKYKKTSSCVICNNEYNIKFLVCAHLKKRSKCINNAEKRNLNNIAPMCKLGCDELFERGYIAVKNKKIIVLNNQVTEIVENYMNRLIQNECLNYNEDNKPFYDWHYDFHYNK
tara:strand:- start:174 stop:1208 length:1035 start_codon:yes stop_codon:yes gene_type:complete